MRGTYTAGTLDVRLNFKSNMQAAILQPAFSVRSFLCVCVSLSLSLSLSLVRSPLSLSLVSSSVWFISLKAYRRDDHIGDKKRTICDGGWLLLPPAVLGG